MARHNRKWDSARSALMAIPGANVNDIDLCKNRTFCCSGDGCFWKEEEKDTTRNHMRFDQIAVANPETLALGCPFRMTMMEDAVKSRSVEEKLRSRDLSELIAESTVPTK
jgi:Fe-S oxidoreductase